MGIFASRKRWKLEVRETYTRDSCSLLFKKEKVFTICIPVKLYGTYICLQEMVFVGTKFVGTLLFMVIISIAINPFVIHCSVPYHFIKQHKKLHTDFF